MISLCSYNIWFYNSKSIYSSRSKSIVNEGNVGRELFLPRKHCLQLLLDKTSPTLLTTWESVALLALPSPDLIWDRIGKDVNRFPSCHCLRIMTRSKLDLQQYHGWDRKKKKKILSGVEATEGLSFPWEGFWEASLLEPFKGTDQDREAHHFCPSSAWLFRHPG